jgi:hypothetical protein
MKHNPFRATAGERGQDKDNAWDLADPLNPGWMNARIEPAITRLVHLSAGVVQEALPTPQSAITPPSK